MAYNRYIGNTGKVIRVQDPEEQERGSSPPVPVRARSEAVQTRSPAPLMQNSKAPSSAGLMGELFSRLSPDALETEDLLLLMIFYLLYRESGDEEFLIMMGAMFLL